MTDLKTAILAGVLAAFHLASAAAQTAAAPVAEPKDWKSAADAAWAAYKTAASMTYPETDSYEMSIAWRNTRYAARASAALWFFKEFRTDPRRWDAFFDFYSLSTGQIQSPSSDYKAMAEREWREAMDTAPDAIARKILTQRAWNSLVGLEKDPALALEATRRQIDELTRRYPDHDDLAAMERGYWKALNASDPAAAQQDLEKLLKHNNPAVVAMAQAITRFQNIGKAPLDLKFTALDGRAVDLKRLRGKVVLVDFWATWCGPCVAQLPFIKRLYQQYRARGLEVVGISLDRADDKKKLEEFVQREALPWPQYYDGKYWKNEIATRYAINAIPVLFLIDKKGMVVATNLEGEVLEARVRELL